MVNQMTHPVTRNLGVKIVWKSIQKTSSGMISIAIENLHMSVNIPLVRDMPWVLTACDLSTNHL